MKILCVGDIVGRPGRDALEALLPGLKREFSIDCTVANGENSAGGAGITSRIAEELFSLGCDVLTLGDHVWDKGEIAPFLNEHKNIIRPANFPAEAPGKGWCLFDTPAGEKIGVINLLGRVFMRYNVNCPFRELKKLVEEMRKHTPNIVVDMHAEATSEKVAIGLFIDGQVSAVVGTHTHVPTADETILSRGTAYITDMGMTGPHDSVIGQNKEAIIKRFIQVVPTKFEVATEDVRLNGVVVDIDAMTGKAKSILRIQRRLA